MAEETFWVVQRRTSKRREWRYALWTLSYWRRDAVRDFLDIAKYGGTWEQRRRRGIARCIKVRVVPVAEQGKP